MSHFDNGEMPSLGAKLLDIASTITLAPLVHALVYVWPRGWRGAPLEHLPFILNSLLWGLVINWLLVRWKSQRPM
ncbi:MAG TPA: hypothetical protein VGE21_01205 [Flavobacteriales bacterium]